MSRLPFGPVLLALSMAGWVIIAANLWLLVLIAAKVGAIS